MDDIKDDRKTKTGSPALQQALGTLDDIRASGYTLVPAEATPFMLEAGAQAGKITPEAARLVYKAMLMAAE